MHRRERTVGLRRRWLLPPLLAAVSAAALVGIGSASASPTASPVVIGFATTTSPFFDGKGKAMPGIKAALGYIREHGGWGGRGLKIDLCDTKGDPASETACFHQWIDNHDVAVFGLSLNSGTIGLPLLTAAGIPQFFYSQAAAQDTSPWQHSIQEGALGQFVSGTAYMCSKGFKKESLLVYDTPSYHTWTSAPVLTDTVSACGMDLNVVFMPLTAPDPAPYVQKALSTNPDMVQTGVNVPANTLVEAFHTAGLQTSKVLVNATALSAALWANPNANGLTIIDNSYNLKFTTNPDVATYLKFLAKYAPEGDTSDSFTYGAYNQLVTIWKAAQQAGWKSLTSKKLNQYMNTKAPGQLHVSGAIAVSKTAEFPGIAQPYGLIWTWANGKPVSHGWWPGAKSCSSAKTCAAGVRNK